MRLVKKLIHLVRKLIHLARKLIHLVRKPIHLVRKLIPLVRKLTHLIRKLLIKILIKTYNQKTKGKLVFLIKLCIHKCSDIAFKQLCPNTYLYTS